MNADEAFECLNKILENIQFVRSDVVSKENRMTAIDLCRDIDEKDSPFVALAIEIDAYLWTGDKSLKEGLIKKGFMQFADDNILEQE